MEKALSGTLQPSDYLRKIQDRAFLEPKTYEYLPSLEDHLSLISPAKQYNQNYVIYRINLQPVEVDRETRDAILKQMSIGNKFVQVDEYTIMLNSINGIEPMKKKKKPVDGEYIDGVFVVKDES